jgi:hypothetical protein
MPEASPQGEPVTKLRLPRLVTFLHRARLAVKGQYAVVTRMSIPFCGMPSVVTRAALDGGPSGATIQTPEQEVGAISCPL